MIGRKWLVGVALVGATLGTVTSASAYTIGSAFTRSCHERMSVDALAFYLGNRSKGDIPLPQNDVWRASAEDIERLLRESGAPIPDSEQKRFAAFSMLLGLRVPDTNGYSVTDINAARQIHGDLSAAAQYAHALRATTDEDPTGDLAAIEGAVAVVAGYVQEVQRLLDLPRDAQILTSHVYLDHYGRVEVDVWGPAWFVGKALHTIQDSHAHSIRSADGAHILHVLNFVDAFSSKLEDGSGLAHSAGMDDCKREEVAPLVRLSRQRSLALVAALGKFEDGDQGEALRAGLDHCPAGHIGEPECGWFAYLPACEERVRQGLTLEGTCCSRDTNFCDSEFLELVEETPTGPYLPAAFGCDWGPEKSAASVPGAIGFAAALVLLLAIRRRRQNSGRSGMFGFVLGTVILLPQEAKAQDDIERGAFVRVEGHGAFLAQNGSGGGVDLSFGPSLYAGYRDAVSHGPRFGFFGFVEQDAWVALEVEGRVDRGVINLGLGAEVLYWGLFRSALTLGPSVLLFDTGLHQPGRTGIFWLLEPLGILARVHPSWALSFAPLSVAWINPTTGGGSTPSLGHLQYRTSLGIEWRPRPASTTQRGSR